MTDQLHVRTEDRLGRITLNRPKAINALTVDMIRGITQALRAWWDDSSVEIVLLDGAGDRGLCAGGDITVVRDSAMGDQEVAATLWREEYVMDQLIARFPKPVVALMDGVVMGGGLGIAGRADVRVVTERSRVAMPEVLIGFTPDCGTADLLAGAPGELGTHVALTSMNLGAADAMLCGLADTYLPSEELAGVPELLRSGSLRSLGTPAPGSLADSRPWIDECYAGDDPAKIVARLLDHPHPDARAAGELLGQRSPTAVAVTLHALRLAADEPGLEPCLIRDFRAIRRFLAHPDLVEGITARVVDRTHVPQWTPSRLAEVEPSSVAAFFDPLDGDELSLES
ncbi:enoyl-CoA hydratase/isomerase family protein [Pseudonocardia spinosispora]|uniref:enoyl-CoA hydratase/isomerase family protein n=1 Tax=Pseudonocardia spinosispora TaxID=103441 RepID=UPI00048E351E|nr:enoyl-CoA hydratase/isomerase family protein [Pseudonocardia spinosispora]